MRWVGCTVLACFRTNETKKTCNTGVVVESTVVVVVGSCRLLRIENFKEVHSLNGRWWRSMKESNESIILFLGEAHTVLLYTLDPGWYIEKERRYTHKMGKEPRDNRSSHRTTTHHESISFVRRSETKQHHVDVVAVGNRHDNPWERLAGPGGVP
jgi:hypothetical protein